MIGLIGNYEVKVDSKGRLRLPTNLLQQIPEETRSQYILNKGMGKCLRLFPKTQWESVTKEMSSFSYFRKDESNFLRAFYQLATQVEMDSNDRILLSKRLMESVGISDEVVITAFHDVIEIWDSKTYAATIVEPENFADMADEVWSKLNNNK
ncbi:MAG: division/cell wall cluster transcriptional repressor MraZ [Chitinophagales bacterium]|nr:division/cell wall cluster transcriptional repressor MraZ [Chitinophagales bacterium]HMV14091.1 division/cell wall cluster transcriptional repressor MraZ [Chitinophagales bacterium]HMW12483.1 division/cell wall cluster transcriptional repressor MraZ [Chitinophagales bacterium]HMX60009.1 division/cell wall cluster transcriptional repressor MraZ [Chitinophagales bacterium]HMY22976.1 division/cell wall cluster transcriptional repressor MraZ [Chitinophagales bacterium]